MTRVPLKRLARIRVSNVDKKSADSEVPVRLCNYTDIYYRDEILPDQEFMRATATPEQVAAFRLRARDVVITKDSETAEDIGVPSYVRATAPDLVCGYHLAIIRPEPHKLDGRFLFWFMSSAAAREQLAVAATGVTRFGLRAESTGAVGVPSWSLMRQRAIADYLDIETARFDVLIAKKRELRSALRERYVAVVREELGHREGVRLKHLLAAPLAYGVLVPVPDPDGVPMLRITDLRSGTIDFGAVNRIPASLSTEYRRTILEVGDLVVSVVGTLGRSIEVSRGVAGANLNRALARVQLKGNVPRSLIRLWFESDDFQLQAGLATSGDSAQPTLGLGDMKNFTVGIPADARRWSVIADRVVRRLSPIDDAVKKVNEQERLLLEHRQALITAAVTGELDILAVT